MNNSINVQTIQATDETTDSAATTALPVQPQAVQKKAAAVINKLSKFRIAPQLLEDADKYGFSIAVEGEDLAFTVERITSSSRMPEGCSVITKTILTSTASTGRWSAQVQVLRDKLPVVITCHGAPEFVLRRIPMDQVDTTVNPYTGKTRGSTTIGAAVGVGLAAPAANVLREQAAAPLREDALMAQVCAALYTKYGVRLQVTNGANGRITVPPYAGATWTFKCQADIQFPTRVIHNENGQIVKVVLGYYEIESKTGFDAASLEEAITHCFNLFI